MYYYYYYPPYHLHSPESQYTVYRSHPIYPYLSVFLNKIFFIESEIVEDNRNLFSEVYELFDEKELKDFDFITIPLNPENKSSSIISELNVKSNLSAEELERIKQFYFKQDFCISSYKEFLRVIRDLFGFKNIHQGGLLWFEPYIHGYRVIFMSAEKFITNTLPKNLKGMFLDRCQIKTLIKTFESDLKNNNLKNEVEEGELELTGSVPSSIDMYFKTLNKAEKFRKANFKKEINKNELVLFLSALNDLVSQVIEENRSNLEYKLEIRQTDWRYGVFVPGIEEEIKLTPLEKTFYFLTLLIESGIKFSELKLHENELKTFYKSLSNSSVTEDLEKTIEYLITEDEDLEDRDLKAGVTIHKSRTRKRFKKVVCTSIDKNCDEILKEILYRLRTSDLIIDLKKEEILGYDYIHAIANRTNGLINN